jgi:hypothetical protein
MRCTSDLAAKFAARVLVHAGVPLHEGVLLALAERCPAAPVDLVVEALVITRGLRRLDPDLIRLVAGVWRSQPEPLASAASALEALAAAAVNSQETWAAVGGKGAGDSAARHR